MIHTLLFIGLVLLGLCLLGAVNTPKIQGLTTIVYSVASVETGASIPSGILWESVAIKPKNSDAILEIENANGAGVSLVFLKDGFTVTATFEIDTSKTYPDVGAAASINLPVLEGGTGYAVFACSVASCSPELRKKQGGTGTMTLIYRPGITPS